MRKALLLGAVLSSMGLVFATNGSNLIGVTPASRGMGGIGVGAPVGPVDSIFRNPAWMSVMEDKFTAQFGGILFMPRVQGRFQHPLLGDSGYQDSQANTFAVPEIGMVHRISDKLVFGIGAFGTSGMGVDYRNKDARLNNTITSFQFMRIVPAIAFQVNDMITISGAIHGAWGSLDLGAGQSQALGVGAQIGASLNFGDFLYGGIVYQSPVSMTYKRVFDFDTLAGGGGPGDGIFDDFKLQQPQEVAIGIGVAPLNGLKLGVDARWINWKNAEGYNKFGWEDQIVVGVGAEYKPMDNLSLRAGYNYGRSPIRSKNLANQPAATLPTSGGGVTLTDTQVAFLNLIGFPAIAEHHITIGVGYDFSKTFGVDLSYIRALDNKVESSGFGGNLIIGAQMAQNSVSLGLNWRF